MILLIGVETGNWQTVNVRNSGSLSCRLSGASGRLVLRRWALLSRRFLLGRSGLYRDESLVVSILVCV